MTQRNSKYTALETNKGSLFRYQKGFKEGSKDERMHLPMGDISVHRTSQGNGGSQDGQGLRHASINHTHRSMLGASVSKSARCICKTYKR